MKYFDIIYRDGSKERIEGNTIQEAFKNAGLGGGIVNAIDYWEEVKEIPITEKYILVNGDRLINPNFIEKIRQNITEKEIKISFGNRIFTFTYDSQTGTEINFKLNRQWKANFK